LGHVLVVGDFAPRIPLRLLAEIERLTERPETAG
jgi:hypothetical protein